MARRTATGDGVVLSLLEFDLMWEGLGRGLPPYPLDFPSHGETMVARDAIGEQVFAGLAEAGLTDGDQVADEVEALFAILGQPERSVDLIVVGGEPLRVVAAEGRKLGVLAALDESEVALEPLPPGELIDALLGIIGDVPPGQGERVTMRREVYAAALEAYVRKGYQGFEEALTAGGVTGRSVRPIAAMITSPRTVAGQFAANGPGGRSEVLAWLDTDDGRYAMLADESDVEPWVVVTPADPDWLARRLSELLVAVAS